MNYNLQDVYNTIKANKDFQQPRSFGEFKAKMQYQGYSSQIYKLLRDGGANVGSGYYEWRTHLGVGNTSVNKQRGQASDSRTQARARNNSGNGGNAAAQQDSQQPQTAAQRALQLMQPDSTGNGQKEQQVDYLSRPKSQMPQYGKAPKGNVSSFVQSLYSQDDAERSGLGQAPYTMPRGKKEYSAFVQNQKRRLERQQQFNRGAATPEGMLSNYTKERNKPIVDTGSPEANENIVKTMGQLEDELNASADKMVAGSGDYIDGLLDRSLGEADAAAGKTMQRYLGGSSDREETPWYERLYGGSGQYAMALRAYNTQISPEAVQKRVMSAMDNTIEGLMNDPKFLQDGMNEAERIGVSPQDYIEGFLKPRLAAKLEEGLRAKQLDKFLPRDALQMALNKYINSNTVMKIATLGTSTRSQRQLNEEAMAMTDEDKNPHYKPGIGGTIAGVAGEVAGMVTDPIFKTSASIGGKVTGATLGNGTSIASKIANGSVMQKLGYMAGSSAVGGGVTGFTFGFASGLVNNLSTGEDTSLGNTLSVALNNATGEAGSFAVMGVAGAPLGIIGQGVGSKAMRKAFTKEWWKAAVPKVGLAAAKTYTEAFGMNLGGYVSQKIQGKDAEFDFWNGTLKSLPTAIGFRLTHLKGEKFKDDKGNNLNWYSNALANLGKFAMSDKAKTASMVFSEEEKQQLFGAGSAHGLMPNGENIVDFARRASKNVKGESPSNYADVESDTEVMSTYYNRIINDPNVSWDVKAKFTTMVMGVIPGARPMHDYYGFSIEDINGKRGKYISSFAEDGTLLSKRRYDNPEQRGAIIYEIAAKNEDAKLKNAFAIAVGYATDQHDMQAKFLSGRGYFKAGINEQLQMLADMGDKNSKLYTDFLNWCITSEDSPVYKAINKVSEMTGMNVEKIWAAFDKDPMKRSDVEQNVSVIFRRALTSEAFPESKPHPEQSAEDGKDVVADNNLGTEKPKGEAVVAELRNLKQAEAEMEQLMNDNDVFSDNFKDLQGKGYTHPQIYDWMIQNGMTEEQLLPYAKYMNQVAKVQSMQRATAQAIEENVGMFVQDWSFHGTMDGQKVNGEQALWVMDKDGRTLLVGSGDVAYNPTDGRPREGVGDMLVCLDPNTGETVYVKVEDTTLSQNTSAADLEAYRRQQLQSINSAPYNQAAQEQAAQEAAKPKTEGNGAQQETVANGNQTGLHQQGNIENRNGETGIINDGKGGTDNMGNTLNSDGSIYTEKVNSLDEIKDEEFDDNPTRSVELPQIPDNVADAIGTGGKPVIIKKNIFKKNYNNHLELDAADSRAILQEALYNPNLVGQTQPVKRPSYKVAIKTGDKNSIVVLDVYDDKKQVEIVGWRRINEKGLAKMQRQAEREGGQFLILSPKDGSAAALSTLPNGLSSDGKDTNISANGNGNGDTLTFEDGTPVPMVKDSKGRPTPDYANMKPEQAAEILTKQFGESAENVVDGQIKKAEKAVKKAEKMKVDYEGEPNDILEQEELKRKTVGEAQKQLEHAQDIKKTLTAKKVAKTLGKTEGEPAEGAHQAGSAAVEKFQGATRIVGNKRTRTLPNKEKVRGHYEIVPAESLTPSHDAMDGYKKADGFPIDENGHTINDRDYENDKAAQQTTDQMALSYDGQAIDNVPVVSDEGIVYDGNGRTMAGQKAAKEGTDGEYINELLDNAENFGFTREQIEQSGIEHPRLVLVSDERMPYTTETFAKFNRNEKKTQSNTEQAVAKAKTLTADEVGAIVAEIDGNGTLDAFFNNPKAINDLVKTLVSKGIIGQNEVAELMEGNDRLSPQGKELVKNILLGSIFKPETIRMLGIDSAIKNKAIAGIRAVMDNVKLGDYSLRDEIDGAIQLLYEARQGGNKVDTLLRTSDMYGENAADRYPSISQMLALALEGKVQDFRDLLDSYNRTAKARDTGEGEMFGDKPTKEELIKEFLDFKKWKDYDTRRNTKTEGGDDVPGVQGTEPEAQGGNGTEAESQRQVAESVKKLATEITKQTGVAVHTDEQEGQQALEDAEATDSNIRYHKETDKDVLDELNSGKTIKVYRAMQVIDGKLYPPMAASVGGKLVEANELGTWIRADENPDLAIPDIDPKTGKQKVDPKTGEPKWKFKLDKGGKDATGKKATAINAAYNPYWHMSRSPLNDQFKSAWIRPNIVVVECEVPESELTSGYKAERAKDAVGEVDWKSGSVSGEVFKQTGRARKVILSRWCKPVRVLSDAEVAQRAKEFVGDAKVEIPENVLTPKQRIAFEDAGFKIGAPEKGVKKSEQIAEALKAGLEIDNSVREHRADAGGAVLDWGNVPTKARISNDELTSVIMRNNRAYVDELDNLKDGETIEHYVDANGFFYTFRVDRNHHIHMDEAIPKNSSANLERIKELKDYYDGERTRHTKEVYSNRREAQSELGRFEDSNRSTARGGDKSDSAMGGEWETNSANNVERDSSRPEKTSPRIEVRQFRTKDGEVYGFVVDGEIYLDTKKMKPETPLHEYTHLWTSALQRVNPAEWENVKKLLDDVGGLKEEMQKLYPELEGDDLYDEMLATYSGREGTKKLEETANDIAAKEGKTLTESVKAKSFLGKVKTALKRYWKATADMLHVKFTSAEDVADKVLADWANGVDPNKIKAEEKKPADPTETLKKAAEDYKREQIDKARKVYADAKASGNEEETTKTAKTLKHLMDEELKGKGYSLKQRQAAIALQVGKKEAETIDKSFDEMDLEEREFTASKNPLTESEINELTSEENRDLIPAALDYLHGNTDNMVGMISYLKIWNDVRSRHENAADNSGAKDGTQLAPADNGGGEGLGLGTGRGGGGAAGQLDRGTGTKPAPGEPGGGEGGKDDPALPAGEQGNKQGEGDSSRLGDVSSGSAESNGGSGTGKDGNVSKQGGRKGSRGPAAKDAGRKPAAKQGTHFPDGTAEQLKKERAEYEQKKKDFWARWKKAGQGYVKIALTPFKKLNLSPEQIEMLPELFKMHLQGGFLKIKEGLYKFSEWKRAMLGEEGKELKMIGLSDEDIDRFVDDYWNTPYEMDGETHTLGEWSSIYGSEKLREKLAAPLAEKYQRQMDAEPIKVKVGDRKNIEETLPYLLPQQQEDVYRAEAQFFGKEHTDREHAYGKGYMFTNGTGTGKTYTGLGLIKRLTKQGKGRILIITPSGQKVKDWIDDGKNLNLDIRSLDDWAKERGTTATTESGEGCVITTFANFGTNKKLLETEWDAVIYDESHRIMENKNGAETARSQQHYMVTNRDESHCFMRLQAINPRYQKMRDAADRFDEQRQKEIDKIVKEYKESHPDAKEKDVTNATYGKLPKDITSFAPADGMTFPKLGKLYNDYREAQSYYINKEKPALEKQAKESWKNTKTIFLSATPFNTRENLNYAEGYIFKYPEQDGSNMSGRTRFYLDHFGAAYKFRYNRLESHISNPEAVAKQEVAFSDYLQHTLGTMSGRIIDSPYDYSRDFPTVAPDHAEDFNEAVQECLHTRHLYSAYAKTIGDYNYGSALFETMKVANIIDRIKEHLDAGRKVVIYHRRVETKEPIQPPFAYMLGVANKMIAEMKPGKEKDEFIAEARAFREKHKDLLQWEQTLDYRMPREQIAKVFGEDNVLFFSGKEADKVKKAAIKAFNDDDSGKNILVIQEASGKEGISLHDTTGNHQRVVITLALPQSPITALQIEGRIYRIGNKSNAIFEYPILGLNSEMMLFGQKFNSQVSTTENLALGSQARNLRDSFAKGILEHSGIVPIDQQGVGGKAFDAPKEEGDSDPFYDAVLDYYSNQKLNKNNREGVDYFPTPEPLGYKMVQWAGLQEGDSVLEPSAGHGAIARYVPNGNELVSIEPSQNLFARLQLKAGGLGRKFLNNIFENYDIHNKHDAVVMNPPFGTAGATAIKHVDKAFSHLDEGGRIVAIIPRGSTDKKFDAWLDKNEDAVLRAEVNLPDITFQQAGTSVASRVVVVDKITDEKYRAKAGYPERTDLSGRYDKIEDFFEDLRNVEMPDRIIDTNVKMMKKSRQGVKDIRGIKGVAYANLDKENGISVKLKRDWRTYNISFQNSDKPDVWKRKMADYYKQYDELQRTSIGNEDKQAMLDEMKKLACKLADMSEEEMQRFVKNGDSTHFREERGLQYSKTDAKDVKNSRIIPEDVDKSVSSQIEKKFDETINDISSSADDKFKEDVQDIIDRATSKCSNEIREVLEYKKTDYENEIAKLRRGSSTGGVRSAGGSRRDKGTYRLSVARANIAAIDRELAYRDARAKAIRDSYGLSGGSKITPDLVERIFKEGNPSKEQSQLFAKAYGITKRLGVEFSMEAGTDNRASGEADINRNINLFLDGLTKTRSSKGSMPRVLLHEMLHQATMGAINLVKSGKAEGMLTAKQIEGVKTILDLYDKVKNDKERFKEEPYGLQNEYEFAAQMADPRQRKALDLDVWDRVKNAAKELANKGDRSMWQTFKDAVKKLFEVSDKDKMDNALNDIMDDFNEKIDDISMNDIEQNGFAYEVTDKDELDRLNKEDRDLFESLNDKRNTRKEYYDTVSELARRIESRRPKLRNEGRGNNEGERQEGSYLLPTAIRIITKDRERTGLGDKGSFSSGRPRDNWKSPMRNSEDVYGYWTKERISELENSIVEWAKANNCFISEKETKAASPNGKMIGRGSEANVYLSKDGTKVIKFAKYNELIRDTPTEYLDDMEAFNNVFPASAYKILGVARQGKGKLRFVLEQPYINGKRYYASDFRKYIGEPFEKVRKLFLDMGFKEVVGEEGIHFYNDKYDVNDISYANVVFKDGKPVIVDASVSTKRRNVEKTLRIQNDMLRRLEKEMQENPNEYRKRYLTERIPKMKEEISATRKQLAEIIKSDASKEGDTHFRMEENLSETNRKFNERLDSLMNNPAQKGRELQLGRPGEFLKDAGFGDAEIVLDYDKLVKKSSESYKNEHPFDIADIKDLPNAINSPIAVFDNTNGQNRGKVILTELQRDGNNFIVAVRATERHKKGGIVLEVNEIKSLFPKEARGIVNWLNTDKACNINKEKALDWLGALRNHRGTELTEQELSDAAKVVNSFDISKQKGINYRIGDNSAADNATKNPSVVANHIDKIAKQVGGKVKMVSSVDEITDRAAKRAIEEGRNVTGWYDEKTGEVHLYMPNIHDRYTAEKTIWHEVVGHKGMRELIGEENYGKFLRNLWYDLDKPENARLKELVNEELRYNPLDFENGIEEGIARLVEDGKGEPGFWHNIKNKVTDLLHEVGYRIAPNTKDVKYLLWLAKNVQKNPNDPVWKMRAEAVRYKLEKEDVRAVTERDGMFYDNDGKNRSLDELTREEYEEATDGMVHFRTTPSAATALDRYHKALDEHGYMFTESYMDNMLSLKKLMMAIVPDAKDIRDIKSSENPYMLQNTMQGAMSDAADRFEDNVMEPLDKAMAGVLDAFEGKKEKDKIRNFNLYLIMKHGLERNRVFFVRDYMEGMDEADAEILQKQWSAEKKDLGEKLRNGTLTLDKYYEEMDEWIRNNVDADFKAGEHDYSGFHGLDESLDSNDPYDDDGIISSVMDSEASMESVKKGSVKDLWSKVHTATSYSLYTDYKNGFMDRERYTHTSQMFDYYVPLRKFDEQTAEDTYGYITEKGDPSTFIGPALMKAKGRKSLSKTNVLAQIGAMGNSAISRGGKNAIKQAFMRFSRNHDSGGLITEGSVWVVKDGTNADGSVRWKEVYPEIPNDAAPKTVSTIIAKFEADMRAKQANGDAKNITSRLDTGLKFERAKDKDQHIVDVMVNGKRHRFYINGNPRAAQALNGLLENSKAHIPVLSTISRMMAQLCTSYNPEFVMRNIIRDAEFVYSHVVAKEGARYGAIWAKYYAQLGLYKGASTISFKDLSGSTGLGLFAKYRNGTLDMNDKVQRYFKEFMENGGETGWVQIKSMKEWEKKYRQDVKTERSKVRRSGKMVSDFFFGNLENLNEVAENIARFATYCASRDCGRTKVASAYDAKEVSGNFNRHGSGRAIYSFKNGDMSLGKRIERGVDGFLSGYLRHYSMFFNAGIQSTNLLVKNLKTNPVGTVVNMMSIPFAMGVLAPLLNNALIALEDEKERNGVKDPYGELPDYIRRNNLCIYKGGGEFVTVPLAIELRAFYGLGDFVAGKTYSPNVSGQKESFYDAVGCMSQLVPVMDYLGNSSAGKNPVGEAIKAFAPSALSPLVEWGMNSDWKGSPIERRDDWNENSPAWQRAYNGTPEFLKDLNKKVNAATNDVAKGNEDMLGNSFLDAVTNPSMLNHFFGGIGGGAATFLERTVGVIKHGKETETKDVPFLRSLLYTPSEQTSLQRTKSKWYNYKDKLEKTMANADRLKAKNVPIEKQIRNLADYHHFQDSSDAAKIRVIELAEKQMQRWKKTRNMASDTKSVNFANQNIDRIMMDAVEELDKME